VKARNATKENIIVPSKLGKSIALSESVCISKLGIGVSPVKNQTLNTDKRGDESRIHHSLKGERSIVDTNSFFPWYAYN